MLSSKKLTFNSSTPQSFQDQCFFRRVTIQHLFKQSPVEKKQKIFPGSPVECSDEKGRVYLCGVVSEGPPAPHCGTSPGKYVNVADKRVLLWIKKHAKVIPGSRKRTTWERKDASSNLVLAVNYIPIRISIFLPLFFCLRFRPFLEMSSC